MKLRYFFGLLIGALLFGFFLRGVDLNAIYESIKSSKFSLILLSLLFNFSNYILRAYRWKIILQPSKDVTFWRCFEISAIGYLTNNIIPRSGDIVRPILIGKRENIPVSTCFGTIFIERFFDFLFLFFIIGLLLLTVHKDILANQKDIYNYIVHSGTFLTVTIMLVIGFSGFLVFQKEKALRFIKFLCRPFPEKVSTNVVRFVENFQEGMDILRDIKKVIYVSLLSIAIMEVLVIQALTTLYAFDSSITADFSLFNQIWICNFVLIVGVLSILIPSPAGIGSFHILFAKSLEWFGETPVLAKSVALIVHFFSLLPIMVVGFFLLYTGGYIESLQKILRHKKSDQNKELKT